VSHGGDRGFKSHRGRLCGAVRKLEKRPSSNLGDSAGSTPACATAFTCVGWASAGISGCRVSFTGTRPRTLQVQLGALGTWRGAMLALAASLSSSPSRVRFPSASLQMSWRSADSHKVGCLVRFQDLQLEHGRVRKQAKRRGREPRDVVGSTPTSATEEMVPWSNGEHACAACRKAMVRFHPGSLAAT
jgi:hypothetical protein